MSSTRSRAGAFFRAAWDRRRALLAFGAALGAAAILIVAVKDHHREKGQIHQNQIRLFFCLRAAADCSRIRAAGERIHDRWERRERWYKLGAVACAAAAGTAGVASVARRRRATRS
jgi:hypothetical protein